MRILADYLTIAGFLTKNKSEYALTPDTALFLDQRSPAYLGTAMEFMLSATLLDGFQHLTSAVRKGGTAVGEKGTLAPEHPEWVTFARTMVPLMKGPAEWIANWVCQEASTTRKVLDVAAGHGLFGIEIAKRMPHVEITAQDWANVLNVAQENAETSGIKDRVHILPGDAFEVEFGRGYDLVLLTNFLHHVDVATCESLLKKVHDCMVEGGRVITLEFIPNEDRVSPPPMGDFGLIMLATTPAGDAYTFSEYDQMFQNVGFKRSKLYDIPASNERVIITAK